MKVNSLLKTVFSLSLIFFISCTPSSDKMFTLMPSNFTGIKFKNPLQYTESFNVLTYGNFYYGGGVSIGDINNDGLSDIYFTGNMVGSRLYINQGNFKFKEIAKQAGVFAEGLWNTGTTMADVNGDGLVDIYVCRSAASNPEKRKNLLFINNGDLTFTEKGSKFGVDDSGFTTQGAFFDYDNDGDLDLYVLNHSVLEYSTLGKMSSYHKKLKNNAYSDKLLRNDNGKFVDVTDDSGLISNILGFGLGIALSDINNDGFIDIYVSNDFNEQDYLYLNNGDGTFTEGLEDYIGHTPLYSMGSDIADFNNDGFTDIMALDMIPEGNHRIKMTSGPDNYEKLNHLKRNGFYNQTMRNMLQLNRGGNYFSEIGQFSGVSNTDWSWASLFTDLDNDGYKDLFITNGYKKDYTNMDFLNYIVQEKINERKNNVKIKLTELIDKMPSILEENYTYKNNGDLTFTKMNIDWGIDQKTFSNAAAYADLDNDGDMDLIVTNLDNQAFIYRNNSEKFTQNNHLKIALKGMGKNTSGIGAKVKVTAGGMTQTQEMFNTRGYQSSVDFNLNFGIGKSKTIDQVEVVWPNQKKEIITAVQPNQKLTLFQKDATLYVNRNRAPNTKLFQEVKAIDFTHKENNYNDFKREIMLPHMLSTLGPKLAIGDVNGDGLEDAFIGGAKGAVGGIFLQTLSGGFVKSNKIDLEPDAASEDMGALFFDADGDRDMDLYVVSGGNEFDKTDPALKDRLYINRGKGSFVKSSYQLPEMISSGSCVKSADYDNDGDLDLFIGGRLIPNQYPYAPNSYLLENDGKGYFTDVTSQKAAQLEAVGMVTDAIWTDFNSDGLPDLILVGEWMPITLFENKNGKLINSSEDKGLNDSEGWWNSIATADFDQDGDLDFIAGNFGLNSQLKTSVKHPVSIYAKDFDENGSVDPILCCYYGDKNYPAFSKDDIQQQLSMLKNRFVRYSEYADLTIDKIFTPEEFEGSKILLAKNFETSYIENLGNNQFRITPLPIETQLAPIYGITTGDFNGDGNLDVVMGGNFTGSRVKYGHYDALKGVCLLGDGKGNFEFIDVDKSGLKVNGEIRDIDSFVNYKGEKTLLFSRNNDAPQLFKLNK
jgi:hypothetical protein